VKEKRSKKTSQASEAAPAKLSRKHSLAARIGKTVFLVYVLSVMLIFVSNFVVTREMMLNDTQDLLFEQINYYEDIVDKWISVRMEHVNILKHNIEALDAEARTDEAILKLLTDSTNYGIGKGVIADYLVYPNDKMLCGDGWVPEPGYTPTQNEYYKVPAKSGGIYVSTPYVDATTGEFIITISVPVNLDGQLYGVLGRDLYIDEVRAIATQYDSYNEIYDSEHAAYLYLLDNEGNILSHANPDYAPSGEVVHNISELSDTTFLGTLSGASELYRATDYDGEGKVFLEKTNAATGWTLGLSYPRQINTDRLAIQLFIGLAIAMVALVVALSYLMRFLLVRLKPIRQVVMAAEEIEQGNLSVKYEVETDDEIGQLARTFQGTTAYLQEVIGEISRILTQIAEGDLRVQTQCDYRGDFQQIQTCIHHISLTLNQVIGGIRGAAEQVALSSDQVAAGSQNLSQSALVQAAQIDTLVHSCDKVSRLVSDNADKCKDAGGITTEITEKLSESNRQMSQMTEAMHRISESSHQISTVNNTINDISFQTNILALNASVEAARAGEAGKGFAVVADEVRNLAAKSAEAAKNTTELINTSISMVDGGAGLSDATAESLKQVVLIAQQVYQIIQEIVTLSRTQAEEVTQIADGIKDISHLIQTNSETAQESASASKELSDEAQKMRELISRFKV